MAGLIRGTAERGGFMRPLLCQGTEIVFDAHTAGPFELENLTLQKQHFVDHG
jgi:hypothetical protein